MPRALEIPIEVTGLDRAQDSLRRLSESVRGVGNNSERMGRQLERALTVSGPAQRLQRAQAALEAAQGSGDAARLFDAQAAVSRATIGMQRARRQMAIAGGGGFADRLTGVLASTRFNAGPVSPLIGRFAELTGTPLTGATGLMIGGTAAALGAFAMAIKQATETLNQFGETMRLTGGTAREVAGMRRFGLGAGDASAFRERISTDPMAQMFAARLGVRALPRPFGSTDEAAPITKAAEALEKMTNAEERLRIERELGLENVERLIQASPEIRALYKQQEEFETQMGLGAKSANDLALATEMLQRQWQDLLAVFATPVIEGMVDDMRRIALIGQGKFGEAFFSPEMTQDNTAAVNANTRAHKDTQEALNNAFLPPGTYGGGGRTRGAMPGGWAGDFLARNMEAGSLARGMPGI